MTFSTFFIGIRIGEEYGDLEKVSEKSIGKY